MTTKFNEQYWRFSLIAFILFLGAIIFKEFLPFLSGILGAFTLYILVRKQMCYLTEKRRWNKTFAAILILIEIILCILVPTFLVIWLLLGRLQEFDLHSSSLEIIIQNFINMFQNKTGYDLLSQDNIVKYTSYFSSIIQVVIGQVSSFVINAAVLLFILYFMLINNRKMEAYIYSLLPFNEENKNNLLKNIKMIVTSNAIGIPLLAVIQGSIATIGYIIFDVPSPLLFGFLTCFATILPLIGTSLIWIPLAVYLGLSGDWFNAIGLGIYALAIISNIDNMIRFILQKKMANTHPLITVFGVIIGLTLFGFWGIIFGPLLLSMFCLLINIFKLEYLDKKEAYPE